MIREVFFGVLIAVALADRYVWKRKQAVICDIGEEGYDDTDNVIRFPVSFKTTRSNIKGARMEYCLRDKNDPSTVITGKSRSLFFNTKGITREYVFFSRKYLKAGDWVLQVRMTHGDCRINPLYRLFPIQTMQEKTFILPAEKVVVNDE